MSYTLRVEGGILWATLRGTVSAADLQALLREAAVIEAEHTPVPHRIIDLGSIDDLAINFEDLSGVARQRTTRQFANDFKSALVAPDLVHYGFARMWQTLTTHSQIRVAVFPNTTEALRWVSAPGLDLPDSPWAPPVPAPSPSKSR